VVSNTYLIQEFSQEIDLWKRVYQDFIYYGLKDSSAEVYRNRLRFFCQWAGVDDAYCLLELGLKRIEEITQAFIRRFRGKMAPKSLNQYYCAVKRWSQIKGLVKSTKMFKEIKFDKTSRKVDALTEISLETRYIRDGFKVSGLDKKIDWGLFALCGLRPALIPQLKVKDIFERNRTIEDGKITLVKPAIAIIPREYKGNKGNITFMVFLTRLCELIEMRLNQNHQVVTLDTKISSSDNYRDVYYLIKQVYKKIGFSGRPYLLRSFADSILERITRKYNDEDFKEFLMGHNGKISAIYQIKGLTLESEKHYREMYVTACDTWINEHIFEMRSQSEMEKARAVVDMMKSALGIDEGKAEAIIKLFEKGKLDWKAFNERLKVLGDQALSARMRSEFSTLMEEYKKANGERASA